LISELIASGMVVEVAVKPRGTLYVHHEALTEAEERILEILNRLHAQWPLRPSIPRDRIALLSQTWHDAQVTDAILDRLVARGAVRSEHRGVALASFSVKLTPGQERLRERLLAAWHEAAFQPPEPLVLCHTLASDETEFQRVVDLCTAQGDLVHLSGDIFLHHEVETRMRSRLERELANGKGLTVSEIRDLLGTTRKFAVPICEYLDRIGFTRREGDLRMLR
jgi:selenocysteine-specific elongation factor